MKRVTRSGACAQSEETRWADEWAARHADSQVRSGEDEPTLKGDPHRYLR